jgi:tetratricopeptide (TPR) repeat protein
VSTASGSSISRVSSSTDGRSRRLLTRQRLARSPGWRDSRTAGLVPILADMAAVEDRLELARHYLEIGNARRALAELEKGGSAAVEDDEFWLIRAEALCELKHWSEAAEAARRALVDFPESITLLDILAICQLELDDPAAADKTILAALEVWPDHPALLAHRALILAHLKRFKEADQVIGEALRAGPESPDVLLARAQVASLQGHHRDATEYAEELLALEPDDELSHLIRGSADVNSARFKHAVRHLEEAARINPENPHIGEALREARIGAHPLLAAVRPVWHFGRLRSWLVYMTIATALALAHLQSVRYVVAGLWITMVILSWGAPPLLRRWYGRRRV